MCTTYVWAPFLPHFACFRPTFSIQLLWAYSPVCRCNPTAAGLRGTVDILLFVPVFLCWLCTDACPYWCRCRRCSVRELINISQGNPRPVGGWSQWIRPFSSTLQPPLPWILVPQSAPSRIDHFKTFLEMQGTRIAKRSWKIKESQRTYTK